MTSLKCATSILAVVSIICFSQPQQSSAADETPAAAMSSKAGDHRTPAGESRAAGDTEAHHVSIRALPLSHKFTGLGKRSSTSFNEVAAAAEKPAEQQAEVDADIEKRALPSSMRFTGLGKRRQGVGAAMRFAGLGKRFPENLRDVQDGLAPEVDYSDASAEAVAGMLDRRRRFAGADDDFDGVVAAEDADENQVLYGLRQGIPASKAMTGGLSYSVIGKRNKPLVKISSRIDPGMRYMGIGKRDG